MHAQQATDAFHILIVEDSRTQAERLRFFLEQHGYRTHLVPNGMDALDYLRTSQADVVISDIVMPQMDGYALCRHIKEDSTLQKTRVILLTSLTNPEDIINGLNCGADNFLTKPFNEEVLLSRLQHMQLNSGIRQQAEAQAPMEIYFGGQRHMLTAERVQIIDLLLSTYENAIQKARELEESHRELRKAYDTIVRLESTHRQLLEQNCDAMLVVDQHGTITYANLAAATVFGRSRESLVGTACPFPVSPNDVREITIPYHDTTRVVEMRSVSTCWEREEACLATLRDVTESVLLREQLSCLSTTDQLTGLYNRRGFLTLAEQQLKQARRMQTGFAILFADLDGMKDINDEHGHHAGDLALQATSMLMRDTFRDSDILARLGGDEFAAVILGATPVTTEILTERLQASVESYNAHRLQPFTLSISVGVAMFNADSITSIEQLLEQADTAMYEQKRSRKLARS